MSELSVVAVLVAKNGQEDVVRQALLALVAPTREEEGCLAYELFESAVAPGTFVTQERWRHQGDLDAHLQTEHVQKALGAAGDALATAPGVHPLVPVT
ncbi:Quinol monooxygenase YgiN [Modestobacter sp. DSM 44400]|uniref:putative quinol monooxygenase n=1 Tax=Modestobacter sp. DSM 44400 TaxID=1550230 RepID=UPI0008969B93|nr:putative quinol monooxygenase [Modestobacter sp. DSM 44400]SDX80855.1 Quinol monooxygenase YgiN [Modestobacter sp. DSM 44400]